MQHQCYVEIAADDRKSAQQNGGDRHCLHVRCRVEWMPAAAQSSTDEVQVVADTWAALPRTCPFVDIVPATLYYFGYNMSDVVGATGTITLALTMAQIIMRLFGEIGGATLEGAGSKP